MGCQQQRGENRTRDTPLWKASLDPLGLCVVYSKAGTPGFRVPPTGEALGWSINKRNSVEETSHRCLAAYCGKRKPDYQQYTISSSLCPSNLEESQVYKKKYAPKKSAFRYFKDSAIVVFLKPIFWGPKFINKLLVYTQFGMDLYVPTWKMSSIYCQMKKIRRNTYSSAY